MVNLQKQFFTSFELTHGKCKITVTGKPFNRGDGDGMQVPCLLQLSGQRHIIEILKQQINDQKK